MMAAITMTDGSNNMDRLLDASILEGVFFADSVHLINFEKESVVKSIITILLGCFLSLTIFSNISHAAGTLGALNDTDITQCQDGSNNWGTCTAQYRR
ncbi:hypothetical protein CCP3SC5AM1_1300005 [Gammaproteobacteria bacterium]